MSVPLSVGSTSRHGDSDSEPFLESRNRDLETARFVEEYTSSSNVGFHKKRYSMKSIRFFGVDLTPGNIAVAMVYFVQGFLGLSRLGVNFYLKDDLHLDPAELCNIWCLVFTMVLDSMIVERACGESQSTSGSLQSLCWGSSAVGGIVSSYFSGSWVGAYGVRYVFGLTAVLPLITSDVTVLVKEQPVVDPVRGKNILSHSSGFFETSKQSIVQLWDTIKLPNVFLPTLFIFLWQATPHSDSSMFYFTTNRLGFTPEFLGRVKLVTSVASLAGVGLYNGFLKGVPLRKIFLATTIIGSALGMTQVFLVTGLNCQFGTSDEWFSIGDSLILTVLARHLSWQFWS